MTHLSVDLRITLDEPAGMLNEQRYEDQARLAFICHS
jgi:hypothetical protein